MVQFARQTVGWPHRPPKFHILRRCALSSGVWGLVKAPVVKGEHRNITVQAAPSTTAYTIVATPTGTQTGYSSGMLSLDNRNL